MAQPAIPNKGLVIREYPIQAGGAWPEGAPLTVTAAGELIETANPPTAGTFAGFAAHKVPMDGVNVYGTKAKIYAIGPESTFWVNGDNAPVAADVGDSFDIALDANGVAFADDVGLDAIFICEDVDLVRGLYEVSVEAAIRQFFG